MTGTLFLKDRTRNQCFTHLLQFLDQPSEGCQPGVKHGIVTTPKIGQNAISKDSKSINQTLPILCQFTHRVEVYSLLFLVYIVAQLNSYGAIWKWVTILSIPVGSVQMLSDSCFCIPSYVIQQLHSLDCHNFVHVNSQVIFYSSLHLSWCRVSFFKRTYNFQNYLRRQGNL